MMEMNKQRKVLIGVLCLGLGGLVVDRFVIGMPEDASANEGADVEPVEQQAPPAFEPSAPEPQQAIVTDQAAATLPSYASLTERLVKAQQQADPQPQEREDPFALPKQWQIDRTTTPAQAPSSSGGKQQSQFNNLFKLDGTVRSNINGKDELLAVISGGGLDSRAIRIGQKLRVPDAQDGYDVFQLEEVGSRAVVWRVVGTDVRIEMQVEEDL